MPYEILEARYVREEPARFHNCTVRVASVEKFGLELSKSFVCRLCGVQLRYVPERNEQRAYFGRVKAPHGVDRNGVACPYLIVEALQGTVANGRRLMHTLFLRAGPARPAAMRLDAVHELLSSRSDELIEEVRSPESRTVRRRAVNVPRALNSARAVVRLMVAMREAGIREASELMDLAWHDDRIRWADFFFSRENIERLWRLLSLGRIVYPVAFVVRPRRPVEQSQYCYSVSGESVGATTPYLNSADEGLLHGVGAGQDVLAFGSPNARGDRFRSLRLTVYRRAQIAEVPFEHNDNGVALEPD